MLCMLFSSADPFQDVKKVGKKLKLAVERYVRFVNKVSQKKIFIYVSDAVVQEYYALRIIRNDRTQSNSCWIKKSDLSVSVEVPNAMWYYSANYQDRVIFLISNYCEFVQVRFFPPKIKTSTVISSSLPIVNFANSDRKGKKSHGIPAMIIGLKRIFPDFGNIEASTVRGFSFKFRCRTEHDWTEPGRYDCSGNTCAARILWDPANFLSGYPPESLQNDKIGFMTIAALVFHPERPLFMQKRSNERSTEDQEGPDSNYCVSTTRIAIHWDSPS
ncbi:hypothetical protein CAEBREN_01274 [Caenorhabditis brenneri]|uniref:Uncharacterized protein n=1 Tax=Caenorhabditis brenneri TaxID=135651 RepID=G0NM91_CAEBE|nr:hypothetical protein CAEBREN_01274 [Caenorhabditis brenneri]